jgi:TRAP-type C4-dicarboxylate transport system permease small subunit
MELVALWCGGVFLVIAIMMAVHTVGRYGFHAPIMGQTELVSVMQLCAVAIGGWFIQSECGHIVIGVFVDKMSPKRQALVDFFTYILCLVFYVLAAWQTFIVAGQQIESGRYTLTLHIPHGPFYLVLGIGWVLFAFATILNLIRFAKTMREKGGAVK